MEAASSEMATHLDELSIIHENNDSKADVTSSEDAERVSKEPKKQALADGNYGVSLSKPAQKIVELPGAISKTFEAFLFKRNSVTWEAFLGVFRTLPESAMDDSQLNYVITKSNLVLRETLPSENLFPDSKTDEKNLAKSISYPLFGLFRFLYENEDKSKKPFQSLLTQICKRIEEVGYLLLYFMKAHIRLQTKKNVQLIWQFKTSVYRQICDALDKSQGDCLVRDLDLLEKENTTIFIWLLPDIYRGFKSICINNSELLKITLRCIDAKNLRDLIYRVVQGRLTMFNSFGLLDCVRKSLTYETIEQFFLWKLVEAHSFSLENLQDIIPELEAKIHAEAVSNVLLMLKFHEPTTELVRLLLSRKTKSHGDAFVTSAIRLLCQHHEEKLSKIIGSILTLDLKNSTGTKVAPSADQVLNHLEHYRRSCRHGTSIGLYVHDTIRRALQRAYRHSNENTKKQYSDLFALATQDEGSAVDRRDDSDRGRTQVDSKKDTKNHNSEKTLDLAKRVHSSDSSEEDNSKTKEPPVKKRKHSEPQLIEHHKK